jgi:hypothetical protein
VIFRATACEREQEEAKAPAVRTITADEYASEMMAAASPDAIDLVWAKAFQMLALLPPNWTISDALSAAKNDYVDAYYSPQSKKVTVVDRGDAADPVGAIALLAHEYTHALQDQDFGFGEYIVAQSQSFDSLIAAKALTEGEANVLGLAVAAHARLRNPDDIDWPGLSNSRWDWSFQTIDGSRSPVITSGQVLPYPVGTDYVAPRRLAGGQPQINTLYANPPTSVLDWWHNINPGKPTLVESLDCFPVTPPTGFVAFDKDTLGMGGMVGVWMLRGDAAASAWRKSDAWRGDSLVIFKSDTGSNVAAAWRTRWATAADASNAAVAMRHVHALGPANQVQIEGSEVALFVGPEALDVSTWAAAMQCGTVDDLPASPRAIATTSAGRVPLFH